MTSLNPEVASAEDGRSTTLDGAHIHLPARAAPTQTHSILPSDTDVFGRMKYRTTSDYFTSLGPRSDQRTRASL